MHVCLCTPCTMPSIFLSVTDDNPRWCVPECTTHTFCAPSSLHLRRDDIFACSLLPLLVPSTLSFSSCVCVCALVFVFEALRAPFLGFIVLPHDLMISSRVPPIIIVIFYVHAHVHAHTDTLTSRYFHPLSIKCRRCRGRCSCCCFRRRRRRCCCRRQCCCFSLSRTLFFSLSMSVHF